MQQVGIGAERGETCFELVVIDSAAVVDVEEAEDELQLRVEVFRRLEVGLRVCRGEVACMSLYGEVTS